MQLRINFNDLVWKVVRSIKNKPSFLSDEDLFQVGFVGLMVANLRYKEKEGPFIPYAKKKIKFAIQDEIRKWAPLSRHELKKVKGNLQEHLLKLNEDFKNEQIKNASFVYGDIINLCELLGDQDKNRQMPKVGSRRKLREDFK